jgi:hypothetical protein
MPTCPQCQKPLAQLSRRCPSCKADLDLLLEYVNGLETNLARAEQLTRAGELGMAFWAYLEVLETDPDNAAARRQVGQVVTAVRQFDRFAPGRRWLYEVRGEKVPGEGMDGLARWLRTAFVVVLVLAAFALGYGWASQSTSGDPAPKGPTPPGIEKQPQRLG